MRQSCSLRSNCRIADDTGVIRKQAQLKCKAPVPKGVQFEDSQNQLKPFNVINTKGAL